MYKITVDDNILHDPDKGALVADPTMEEGMDKTGSVSFSIPMGHDHYDDIHKLKSIVKVYKDESELFRGRVLNDESDFNNSKKITVEGELSYMLDSIQRPYDDDMSLPVFLQFILTRHNEQVDDFKEFKLGNVTVDYSSETADDGEGLARTSTEYQTTKNLWDDTVSKYYGHSVLRYESDGTYVDVIAEYTHESNQTIEFGKNLLDLTKYIKGENVKTAIIPLGVADSAGDRLTIADVNNGKDYIYDQTAVDLFGWIYGTITHDDIDDDADLLVAGEKDLDDAKALSITLSLTAVDLSLLDVDMNRLKSGDWVRVVSQAHDLDVKMQVQSMATDMSDPKNSKVTLGCELNKISNTESKIESTYVSNDSMSQNYYNADYIKRMYMSAEQIQANYLTANQIKTSYLTANQIQTDYLTAEQIKADYASMTYLSTHYLTADEVAAGFLSAASADLRYANIDLTNIADAVITSAKIESLDAGKITTGNIDAARISAGVIDAVNASVSSAVIDAAKIGNLNADKITTGDIDANRMKTNVIDAVSAYTGNAWITNAMIQDGVINTAQIADASITSAKIVELTANLITAGTLSVERLILRGTDQSLVYALNNIDGATQLTETSFDTLNAGDVLTDRSITADKIVAKEITAAEIAANVITANEILAGTITSTEIAANTITADNIAANTITADRIAGNTLTLGQMAPTLQNDIQKGVDASITANELSKYKAGLDLYLDFSSGTGLVLGNKNSPFKTNITNTQLSFTQNEQPVAWIDTNGFNFTEGVVKNNLEIGNFLLNADDGGAFSIM